jgi:hypothetical protein
VAGHPGAGLEQYEALRREATEPPGGARGPGLALFLARGLPGWLAALTALAPAGSPPGAPAAPSPDRGPRLPSAARAELTTVLAGMVLACTREREER